MGGGVLWRLCGSPGSVAGYLCTILAETASANEFVLAAPPLAAMAQASVLSVAACLIATAFPLRRIARMQIVAAVETAEEHEYLFELMKNERICQTLPNME